MNRMNAKKLIAAVLAAINMTQYEFTTTVGTPINFTNISGYDDYDGLLNTHLEGYVDYNTAGDYYPSITCTDFSGNKTSVPITIHVLPALEEDDGRSCQPVYRNDGKLWGYGLLEAQDDTDTQ